MNLHAIEQMQLRGQRHVDGVGRPKFVSTQDRAAGERRDDVDEAPRRHAREDADGDAAEDQRDLGLVEVAELVALALDLGVEVAEVGDGVDLHGDAVHHERHGVDGQREEELHRRDELEEEGADLRFEPSLRLPAAREVAVPNVVQTRGRAARILMFFVHTHPQTILKVFFIACGRRLSLLFPAGDFG